MDLEFEFAKVDMAKEEVANKGNCWDFTRTSTRLEDVMGGSSNKEGASIGIFLLGPGGEQISQAIKFNFPLFNSEAEYEAPLARLKVAMNKVDMISVFCDS